MNYWWHCKGHDIRRWWMSSEIQILLVIQSHTVHMFLIYFCEKIETGPLFFWKKLKICIHFSPFTVKKCRHFPHDLSSARKDTGFQHAYRDSAPQWTDWTGAISCQIRLSSTFVSIFPIFSSSNRIPWFPSSPSPLNAASGFNAKLR